MMPVIADARRPRPKMDFRSNEADRTALQNSSRRVALT
jgi:hypothetical protein